MHAKQQPTLCIKHYCKQVYRVNILVIYDAKVPVYDEVSNLSFNSTKCFET